MNLFDQHRTPLRAVIDMLSLIVSKCTSATVYSASDLTIDIFWTIQTEGGVTQCRSPESGRKELLPSIEPRVRRPNCRKLALLLF